ncbi:cupin domain-containing protein [Lysobacter enzymogenes]|uniref:cupin domain-containing protein n=1 Tax=Lysobacter enzymogenes TaxID=69 RepID=UPI0033921D07
MTPIQSGLDLQALDPWGTVADLGSQPLEGEVRAYGRMTHGAPTDPVSAGYFGATRGKFRLVYPFDEHAVVVSGEVALTDESTGVTTHYRPGDAWFVAKGTSTVWEILSDGFVKHYFAVA